MPPSFYQIRQCENAACGLRYPLTEKHPFGERCPLCMGATSVVVERGLEADVKFREKEDPAEERGARGRRGKVEALLDNVRSGWNVGAIFRTADAFGVSRLHLCGITPTPENEAVRKTSLGAEETVAWDYARN